MTSSIKSGDFAKNQPSCYERQYKDTHDKNGQFLGLNYT
ncbi:hypothetical protein GAGA_1897 [Paraglaciecola agarilytica NO2]|uniref:Uncharacterized protein n=1 Tax=Paraglaciecola agarilytica NO2 TaxID=1125747 RepID=A0ABQ0I620_9ALTE|nr:hypothetical protein GAGA_1897 [Paraglaciecola agarilytica NO2]